MQSCNAGLKIRVQEHLLRLSEEKSGKYALMCLVFIAEQLKCKPNLNSDAKIKLRGLISKLLATNSKTSECIDRGFTKELLEPFVGNTVEFNKYLGAALQSLKPAYGGLEDNSSRCFLQIADLLTSVIKPVTEQKFSTQLISAYSSIVNNSYVHDQSNIKITAVRPKMKI